MPMMSELARDAPVQEIGRGVGRRDPGRARREPVRTAEISHTPIL